MLSLTFALVLCGCFFFFFKQKTAYDLRISDWSSDVCSSDLNRLRLQPVILEHEFGNIVGHPHEQRVAVVLAEAPLGHLAVQCDLDIDLIVRAVEDRKSVV